MLAVDGFTGVSIQTAVSNGFDETLKWVQRSADADQKWVVAIDEQTPSGIGVAPDTVDPYHDSIRSSILWANLLAGGAGVEYYFVRVNCDHSLLVLTIMCQRDMKTKIRI